MYIYHGSNSRSTSVQPDGESGGETAGRDEIETVSQSNQVERLDELRSRRLIGGKATGRGQKTGTDIRVIDQSRQGTVVQLDMF